MGKQLAPPEVITANAFRLKDENGRTRALLTTLDNGKPSLLLFDDKGQSRLEVGLQADGAPRFVLNCEDDITVVVEISNPKRPVLQVMKNGSPVDLHLKRLETV